MLDIELTMTYKKTFWHGITLKKKVPFLLGTELQIFNVGDEQ